MTSSRRLTIERRALGLLGLLGLAQLLLGLIWIGLLLEGEQILALSEDRLALLIPALQLSATCLAIAHVFMRLPIARWPASRGAPSSSSGGSERPDLGPSPWPLALAGTPSLLFWPLLAARDRAARKREFSGEDLEIGFRELLDIPRLAALSLLAWLGVATIIDGWMLARHFQLTPYDTALLLGLWLSSLLPLATLAGGRVRAMLVPEYLSAPRPNPLAVPTRQRLSARLGFPAGMALAAAAITPALAGAAWNARLSATVPNPALLVVFIVFALSAGAVSLLLLLRDVDRDLGRAGRQVGSVANGDIPEPMAVETFATRELRELVAAVDRLVGRITDANVAKYVLIEKGQEADRLKGQFLANMSHDLRSPLNSVIGFSELLTTGIEGELSPDQREMVVAIHQTGRSLLQQIDDILDTAKIEAGRMELHAEPTPPATLLSRAIERARPHLDPQLEIETSFAAGLPPAFADPYRTAQALENVLRFAAEGLSQGHIAMSCSAQREPNDGNHDLVIRVTSPRALGSLEALEQAQRGFVRVPGQSGLGLGLPIATSIFELQGGSLRIEADPERTKDQVGLRVEIRVPALVARRSVRLRVR